MWRGLDEEPAAVFASRDEQLAYLAARQGSSHPGRPELRQLVSLLVTREELHEQLLGRRATLRRELGEAEWARCVEFFVNKRDHPLQLPPGSTAVLSQYVLPSGDGGDGGDGGDLPLPAVEDYVRCFPGRRFGRDAAPAAALPAPPPWEQRRPTAVFRGGATGAGVTPETNPRLRLAQLSRRWRGRDEPPLLDCELTSWNLRQKRGADGVLRLADPEELRRRGIGSCGRQHFLSWAQQAEYRFAVYLPGNVAAGRLGALLGLGFCILAPGGAEPALELWRHLEPGVHYWPLRSDLGDLRAALLHLRAHDAEARRLAEAARALWARRCGTAAAMEAQLRAVLRSLPAPDDERLLRSLEHLWTQCRAAVYCLVDGGGRLRLFAPFANEFFHNGAPEPVTEPAPLAAFLRRVRAVAGEEVRLPWQRWWSNGALVCNVMPADVWGESMLPALRLMLQRAASED